MPWLAVDKENNEFIYEYLPIRSINFWSTSCYEDAYIELPKGSIKKLIGKELTWDNEPIELKIE